VAALRKAYESVADAVRVRADRADDADANLALGKFHALARGDWDRGLPLLARGSDPKLKALSTADLGSPADANGALELADAYAGQAEAESGAAKTNLLWRACWWYEQAEGQLSGLDRTRVEKTVANIDKTLPASRPVVLHARYGAYNGWADVTDRMRWLLVAAPGQQVSIKWDSVDLGIPDPAPGEHKSVVVTYRHRGGTRLSVTGQADVTTIPAPPGPLGAAPGRPAPGQELIVLYGRWGNESTYADVTARVQAAVKGGRMEATPEQLALGDPFFGRHKALIIVYRERGKVRLSVTPQEAAASLGVSPAKP
jgi:hypothetical protein